MRKRPVEGSGGRSYSLTEVQGFTMVPPSHIGRWVKQGLLTPDFGGGEGSGSHRRFSFRNLFQVKLAYEIYSRTSSDTDLFVVFERLNRWQQRSAPVDDRAREVAYPWDDDLCGERWRDFISPGTRSTDVALLAVPSGGGYSLDARRLIKPLGDPYFFTMFDQLEAYIRRPEVHRQVALEAAAVPPTHLIVDVLRLLEDLEIKASDSFVDVPTD